MVRSNPEYVDEDVPLAVAVRCVALHSPAAAAGVAPSARAAVEHLLAGAFVSAVYALLGWLIAFTARAALRPGVNMNRTPGVRTAATMRSPEHWIAAHRAVERPLHRTGLLLAVISPLPVLLGTFLGDPPVIAMVLLLAMAVVPYVGYLGHAGNRAAAAPDRR